MNMRSMYDFTDVKVGDKVIVCHSSYYHSSYDVDLVTDVKKASFTIKTFGKQRFNKNGGDLRGGNYWDKAHTYLIRYDEEFWQKKVREREERKEKRELLEYCQDNINLSTRSLEELKAIKDLINSFKK